MGKLDGKTLVVVDEYEALRGRVSRTERVTHFLKQSLSGSSFLCSCLFVFFVFVLNTWAREGGQDKG